MHRDSRAEQHRWSLTLLTLATAALFLLLHPYHGLVHDSRLYTIQALSHLHPELYGGDIFVRLGSQDDYTLFSLLYVPLISWLGVEHAAACLTLAGVVLFLLAVWMLARCLLSSQQALVALLLIVLLPSDYGPQRIFHYLEQFLTPRQLAEALTVFGLIAWFKVKRILATSLAAAAMFVHPIIGLAGITIAPTIEWVIPRWRRLWPIIPASGLLAVLAIYGWLPLSRWQFDREWYDIVMHRTYLYLGNWSGEDWARIATVLSTLGVAALLLRDRLQQIALGALVVSVGMLILSMIGGDLLHIRIIVQAQPWRTLWLATVLAVVLLPPLFSDNWRAGALKRCALLLLAAAWTGSHETLALTAAPLAVVAAACSGLPLPMRYSRLLLWGAWAVPTLAVISGVATSRLIWAEGLTQLDTVPVTFSRLLTLGEATTLPALILLLAGWLVVRFPSRWLATGLAAICMAAIGALVVPATRSWATARYDKATYAAFSEWRAEIPPGTDVMWEGDDSAWGDGATNTWMLLERPSFVSGTQAPNALFSHAAALEMRARTASLWGLMPFVDPFRAPDKNKSIPNGAPELAPICQTSTVRYIVTKATMSDAMPVPAPATAPLFLRDYKLYVCP